MGSCHRKRELSEYLENPSGRETFYLKIDVQKVWNESEEMILTKGDGDTVINSIRKSVENLYVPKVLILMSRYPYFEAFEEIITNIYTASMNIIPLPIEFYINNIVLEVSLKVRPRYLLLSKVKRLMKLYTHHLTLLKPVLFNILSTSSHM
jgi:hypothetical protein